MNEETKPRGPKIVSQEERLREQEIMDRMISDLFQHNARIHADRMNVGAFEYIVQFPFPEGVIVTICLLLKDWETTSDVVITNMTTLPPDMTDKEFGSRAIRFILDWALRHDMKEIRATQVIDEVDPFWIKNGFTKCPPPNKTGDLIRRLS